MLPTKGYFQDIECPFYNTTCGRPYCHFRHKRKPNENVDDNVQDTSKNVVPTYKPTPKSELANIHNSKSHIPISYVPDLAFKRERTVRPIRIEKPTYNPTPLSILSSATKPDSSLSENHEHEETIKDIQENIANNIYDPLKSEIDFEDLSNEFELIEDIINNDSSAVPQECISHNLIKLDSDIEKEQNRLNLLKSGIDGDEPIVIPESNNSQPQQQSKPPEFSSDEDYQSSPAAIAKEPLQKSSNFVEIKKDTLDKKSLDKDRSIKSETKPGDSKDQKTDDKSKSSQKDKPKSSDKNKDRSSSKEKSNKDKNLKQTEKTSKSHKSSEREKHRKEEKKHSSKDRESSKDKHSDKHKSKPKSKDRSKSPKDKKSSKKHSNNKDESTSESNSNNSSPERHRKEKKRDSSKTKRHKSKEKSPSRSKKKEKKPKSSKSRSKSRSLSREKHTKSKHKSKHRSRSGTRPKDEEKTQSKSIDKEKNKNKEKRSKDSDKPKDKDRSKSRNKEKKSSSSTSKRSAGDKKEKRSKLTSESNYGTSDNDNDQYVALQEESPMDTEDLILSDLDLDFDDEDETMRECYKIFSEYKPEPIRPPPVVEEVERNDLVEEDMFKGKKRTAHAGAENFRTFSSKLPQVAPPKSALLPGQILTNRYKIAKMAQASNEQENIMNEVRNITQQSIKRPAKSLLEAARMHKIKRLQQQKSAERAKASANLVDDILNGVHKPSATQVKVAPKKIAAVPNVALIEKAKQRISLVKQQRLQNVKTIAHTQKGSRVAHVPEYSLSDIPDVLQAEKSKLPVNVRTRFLTMIAEECSKIYALKEDAYSRALNEEFACYEKCKVLATYRNSAMLAVNRLRKELQERDNKGLGPLLSGERPLNKKETDFEGKTFYNHVKKWLLTEEELDLNGYPRESGERGKSIIHNRTEIDYSIVDENQRKCSRCGKIYQVDDDGWPLFEEECMYHPLKKRTIRGEQVFLCCKSNDDTGCVTSDTHVFDGLEKHLLEGYQTTLPPESDDDARSIQVYALDCEMCYTTKGLELTRVTVVDIECKTVYESFVKPLNPIIDYNTRFSGITKDQMDRTSTSILQVQANILHLCNSQTILVGHSLESDMKALKIVHGTVIDTSVLFPHKMGPPHKRALRALASEYLKKIIQNDVAGHDSAEDAVACMDLIKWKLKEELKTRTK